MVACLDGPRALLPVAVAHRVVASWSPPFAAAWIPTADFNGRGIWTLTDLFPGFGKVRTLPDAASRLDPASSLPLYPSLRATRFSCVPKWVLMILQIFFGIALNFFSSKKKERRFATTHLCDPCLLFRDKMNFVRRSALAAAPVLHGVHPQTRARGPPTHRKPGSNTLARCRGPMFHAFICIS